MFAICGQRYVGSDVSLRSLGLAATIIAGVPPVLLALNESPWLARGVLIYFTAVQILEG